MISMWEDDGDKYSTFQIFSGRDGYGSTCLCSKRGKSGTRRKGVWLLEISWSSWILLLPVAHGHSAEFWRYFSRQTGACPRLSETSDSPSQHNLKGLWQNSVCWNARALTEITWSYRKTFGSSFQYILIELLCLLVITVRGRYVGRRLMHAFTFFRGWRRNSVLGTMEWRCCCIIWPSHG